MKVICYWLKPALLAACIIILGNELLATTCVQNKPFKVGQLCGIVVDSDGVPIRDVSVELVDLRTDLPDVVQTNLTDSKGAFGFQDAPAGEYAIRARFTGFATANQAISVGKPSRAAGCKKPIKVVLRPAGNCSSVSAGR